MVLVARVVHILDALEGFKILSVLSIKTFAYHFRFNDGQSWHWHGRYFWEIGRKRLCIERKNCKIVYIFLCLRGFYIISVDWFRGFNPRWTFIRGLCQTPVMELVAKIVNNQNPSTNSIKFHRRFLTGSLINLCYGYSKTINILLGHVEKL